MSACECVRECVCVRVYVVVEILTSSFFLKNTIRGFHPPAEIHFTSLINNATTTSLISGSVARCIMWGKCFTTGMVSLAKLKGKFKRRSQYLKYRSVNELSWYRANYSTHFFLQKPAHRTSFSKTYKKTVNSSNGNRKRRKTKSTSSLPGSLRRRWARGKIGNNGLARTLLFAVLLVLLLCETLCAIAGTPKRLRESARTHSGVIRHVWVTEE